MNINLWDRATPTPTLQEMECAFCHDMAATIQNWDECQWGRVENGTFIAITT